jgi:hypothetical protein
MTLSLKNNVNVALKSIKQEKLGKHFFVSISKVTDENTPGVDPDPFV